jgi:O-antigen/teichoic acid export membrane protein
MNAANMEKKVLKLTVFGLVINVVLNIFLIRELGFFGASVATLITVAIMSLLFWHHFRKSMGLRIKKTKLLRILVSTAVMSAFIMYFSDLHLFILIPAAAIVFFISALVTRGIDEEEISVIRSVFGI